MLIDFSKLVPAAQKGDEKAMEEICLAFRPLALNLGHKKRYAVLEDNVESMVIIKICVALNCDLSDIARIKRISTH